jgi:hypothetical protein
MSRPAAVRASLRLIAVRHARLASVALFVSVVAGCAGPHGGATTSDVAGCAAVLPLARDVVHGHGTLTLVRKISGDDIDAITREAGVVSPPPPAVKPPKPPPDPNPPAGHALPKTCLVVYQGDYPPGAITGASPPALTGTYALIILRVRHPGVYRILITNQLPPATAHRPWWHFF